MPAYYVHMSPSELRRSVIHALSRPGYGVTAEDVLLTCQLVAQAERTLGKEEVDDIQGEINISNQTWKRMVSISKKDLLWELRNVLPANLSALYRLSLLKEAALKRGVEDGLISTGTTTREIESLKKSVDVRSRFKTSTRHIYLFCRDELDDATFARLLARINEVAYEYNACFDTQDLEVVRKENNRRMFDIRRQLIESSIDSEISMLASPAAIHDGIILEDNAREEIKMISTSLSFGKFVTAIKKLSSNREEMMKNFGRLYCLKLAQEYWRTDSRTQRYNYKKRLRDVQSLYPQHARHAEWVLDSFIQLKDQEYKTDSIRPKLHTLLDDS